MKTLIIYHTGVGNTKTIASILYKILINKSDVTMMSIEDIPIGFEIDRYDNYIIGFPTYHASPSPSILKYLNSIKLLMQNKPAYIFTTCGMYSANTLRIFAKKCITKNIMPVMYCSYRCPATDGALIAPNMKIWFTFEKDIKSKIVKEADRIIDEFSKRQHKVNLPRFKFYSIINYPNKIGGHFYKPMIYIYKSRCIKCERCRKDCPMDVLYKISGDKEAVMLAEMREKAMMDEQSRLNGARREARREGKREGKREGGLEALKETIIDNLSELGNVSQNLISFINKEDNIDVLKSWIKIAVIADSLEEFEEKIK